MAVALGASGHFYCFWIWDVLPVSQVWDLLFMICAAFCILPGGRALMRRLLQVHSVPGNQADGSPGSPKCLPFAHLYAPRDETPVA